MYIRSNYYSSGLKTDIIEQYSNHSGWSYCQGLAAVLFLNVWVSVLLSHSLALLGEDKEWPCCGAPQWDRSHIHGFFHLRRRHHRPRAGIQPRTRCLQALCPPSPAHCPQTDLCPITLLSEWETLEVMGSGVEFVWGFLPFLRSWVLCLRSTWIICSLYLYRCI